MPDDLSATLAENRALIAERIVLAARTNWADPAAVSEFNAVQDKLAARVLPLLGALDAALAKADDWAQLSALRAQDECAEELREAIARKLTGKDGIDE